MARTLKQYKENRKRRLAAKPQRTIVPHMQVVLDEDILIDAPLLNHEIADDFQPPPHTPPPMPPLTVCPFAPVKPKELTIIQEFSPIFFN